jgi:hypothetical protein
MRDNEQQKARDALFERAGRGEISGEEADAEAERLGLGRLSHQPRASEYDPAKETYWTLPMAIAWIAYGTLDAVRDHWSEYRAQCMDWHWSRYRNGPDGEVTEGWLLQQRSPASVATLALGAAYDAAHGAAALRMKVGEAEDALWIALKTDCFRASGLNDSGRRVEIPPLEWNDLKLVLGNGDREELRYGLGGVAFREVLLLAASIRGLWAVRPPKEALTLPQLVLPEGDGYMPLFSAAQWIATRGGTIDFDPEDVEVWRLAFEELLAAAASERVGVIGMSRSGMNEDVPGRHFAACKVDYPYQDPELDLMLSEELYLRSYPYDDEDDWQGGFSDALVDRHGYHWKRLMVLKSEVLERWPFEKELAPRSGAPGRPSSMYLIAAEFDRRAAASELAPTLKEEAQALRDWLVLVHPGNPPTTAGTIENNIRQGYRRHRSPTK